MFWISLNRHTVMRNLQLNRILCLRLISYYSVLQCNYAPLSKVMCLKHLFINKQFWCCESGAGVCLCMSQCVCLWVGDAKTRAVVSEYKGHAGPPEMVHHGRLLTLCAHELLWEKEMSTQRTAAGALCVCVCECCVCVSMCEKSSSKRTSKCACDTARWEEDC